MVKRINLPLQLRKKAIEQNLERICRTHDIVYLGLFGSFGRGQEKRKSDVDLLVRFNASKKKSLLDLIHTENEMKKLFKRKVDLVTERSLSPYLKEDILNSVKIIYEE